MKDELNELFAHETDDAVPADHEARIRAGLGALLGTVALPNAVPSALPSAPATPPPLPRPEAAAAAGTNWATALLVGAGMGVAGFLVGRATAPPVPVVPPAASTVAATSAPPIASTPAASAPSAIVTTPPAPSASAPTPAATPLMPSATSTAAFDRELSLLERARSALVRHDAAAAAEALDACDREFPGSRHTEEREYLRIQLLREVGNLPQLRARARAFLERYPQSLFRKRVEQLAE